MELFTKRETSKDTASMHGTKTNQYSIHKKLIETKAKIREERRISLCKDCAQEFLTVTYLFSLDSSVSPHTRIKTHWSKDRLILKKKKKKSIVNVSLDFMVDEEIYDLIVNKGYTLLDEVDINEK